MGNHFRTSGADVDEQPMPQARPAASHFALSSDSAEDSMTTIPAEPEQAAAEAPAAEPAHMNVNAAMLNIP